MLSFVLGATQSVQWRVSLVGQAPESRSAKEQNAACRWQSVTTLAQKAYTWRLRVLPYHYTAFFDSHTYGCSVMRPLFFAFPSDTATYYNNYQ